MAYQIDWISEATAQLGEGPVWDSGAQTLHWVDIIRGGWHRYTPRTQAYYQRAYDVSLGFLAPMRDNNWLLGLESGLLVVNERGEPQWPVELNPLGGRSGARYNDAKVDPAGGLWLGVMDKACQAEAGALFRLAPGAQVLSCLRQKLTVPNGMAWAADNRTLYFIDSPTQSVTAYEVELDRGSILCELRAFKTTAVSGYPDGMTIDREGMLWIAHWGGGCVSRWDPQSGRCLQKIDLPVSNVTSCTFGGKDYSVLYITTAYEGLSDAQRNEQPLAGSVFAVKTDTQGYAPSLFIG